MGLPFPRRKDWIQVARKQVAKNYAALDTDVNAKEPGTAGCKHSHPLFRELDRLRQELVHAQTRKF